MKYVALISITFGIFFSSLRPAKADLISYGEVGSGALLWNTADDVFVTMFVKHNGSFLNPNDNWSSFYVGDPGVYNFELRLNKGSLREMSEFNFFLRFENGSLSEPDINVTGTRDSTGGTPGFSGDTTHIGTNGQLITLTGLRVSSFNAADEVGEFVATPDSNIDYVGSFQLTVTGVPEPGSLLMFGVAGILLFSRLRSRDCAG